jgi:hypothetical protein
MSKDFDVIKQHAGAGVPPTGDKRRPDYRSCGPKLTAGVPATLADFEQKIRGKILR